MCFQTLLPFCYQGIIFMLSIAVTLDVKEYEYLRHSALCDM